MLLLIIPAILLIVVAISALNVPRTNAAADFIVAASSSVKFPSGQGGSSIVHLNATGGFAGTVALTTSIAPMTGMTVSCNPSSGINIGGTNGNQTSNCGYSSTLPGTYTVTITGTSTSTSGTITHTTTVVVTVVSFTIGLTPSSLTFNSGSTSSLTATFINSGINETLTLSDTVNVPGLTVTFNPPTLTLNTKTSPTPTSTVVFSASTPNVYNVTIIGAPATGPTNSINAIINVLGYTLSASPNSFVDQSWGASPISTITVHSFSSFAGTVTLGAQTATGITALFSPATVTLTAGGSSTSTLTLTLGTPLPGNYTIVVTGSATVTGGSLASSTSVLLQAVGKICLADPSSFAGACPAAPYTFNGPAPMAPQKSPTQIRIGVFAQGSDFMNTAGVTTLEDNTILFPYAVDLSGSILPGATVQLQCNNGVLVVGTTCRPTDSIGTFDVVVSAGLGSFTQNNATGLLFTLVYNITGTAKAGGSPVGFQTGCGATSVTGGVCIAIANGSTRSVPETRQVANFDNEKGINIPWIAVVPYPTAASSTPQYTVTASQNGVATLTLTAFAENGWPTASTDNIAYSAVAATGFTPPSVSPSSCATGGSFCNVTASFNTGTPGSYSVTIFGTYAATDTNATLTGGSGLLDTLVAPVTIQVNVQAITWTVNGLPIVTGIAAQNYFMAKSSVNPQMSLIFTVQSLGGFTGPVTYSSGTMSPGTTGAVVVFPATFTLAPGATVTKLINFTATTEGKALWQFKMVSGTTTKTTALNNIFVSGFTTTVTSTSLSIPTGGSTTDTVTLTSLGNPVATNGFTGSVAVTGSSNPTTGLVITCTTPTVPRTGSATSTCTFASSNPGTYTTILTGTGGTNNDMTNSTAAITVTVTGDFTVAASPTSVTIIGLGTPGTSTITVTAVSGLSGTINLTNSVFNATNTTPQNGLTCNLNPASVVLGTSGTSSLSCTAISAGSYRVQVFGTFTGSNGLSHVHNLNVTYTVSIAVPDFTIAASSPAAVNAGLSATSTITVTAVNGFTGVVTLTDTSPAGLTCGAITPGAITSSGTATIACSATVAGTYMLTITGTSGSLVHSATATFNFVDFTIAASSPSAVTVGTSATSTITITAQNGFTGVVSLTDTVPTGLTCGAIIPNSVTGSGTATVSCSTTVAGPYVLSVAGTSATLAHSAIATFTFNAAQDFTIAASSPATVTVGQSATSTITITAQGGFAGTVSLTDTIPTGLTCGAITPSSVSGSGTATVSCSSTTAGTYSLMITGTSTSPALTHTATATFTITDFTLTASPTSVIVNSGIAGTSTVTVAPVNGFTGTVALTSAASPTGVTCTLSSTSIVLGASQTSTLSCSGAPGTHTVTVTGTSGSVTHTATVTYTITDFTVAASSTSINVNAGAAGTSTITVAPVNGFTGTVALTSSVTPTGLTCTLSSTSIVLGASQTSTLSCSSATATSFTVTVTGTSGSLTHTATVTFVVQDFTISANPTSAAINVAGTATSTITVTAVNGFAGAVGLTATVSPSIGLACTLNPTSVTGSGTSALSCIASASGAFTVTISGNSGTLSHSATFSVSVAVADFTVSASPTSVATTAGTAALSTVTVAPVNAFSGTVALTSSVSPAGLTCTLSPTSIVLGAMQTSTLSCSGSAGTFAVTVTGTSGSLTHTATVTYTVTDFTIAASSPASVPAGSSASSTITVTAVNGFIGVATLTDTVPAGLTCGALTPTSVTGSGTATLSCTSTTQNTFSVTITGASGSLSHSTTATFTFGAAPDFTIAVTSPAAVNTGSSATSTITITALNGFTGVVTLTDAVPSGLTCGTITPTSVTGSGSATVSCSAAVANNYSLTVTGTSGTLTHSATATFTVVGFTVAATSPSGTVGASIGSTITVTGQNGFSAAVALTDTVPAGLTCGAITPSSVTGSGIATLSCTSTTANSFGVTITGTSGSLTHSATATFTFSQAADFTVMATSPTAVNVGSSATSTITVTALNGFAGTVSLTDMAPAGLTCGTITPSTVSGSSTATVSCSSTTAGAFALTVTGTSGSITHSATANFNFVDFTIGATSPSTVTVGSSATSTITIAALNGFAGTVSLTDTVPAGLTCGAITPAAISGAGTATLTCTSTTANTFTVTITGTSGSLSHSVTATFTFANAADFSISATSPAAVNTGVSASSTITVTALNGFSGSVALTDTLPLGLTCGAITPSSVTDSGTATLSCTSASSGSFTVTVTGTSGSLVHSATATFMFTLAADFTISASSPVAVNAGQSTSSTITITAVNGFSGAVTLTDAVPTSLVCGAITPNSVTGSGTATVSCSATLAGSFTVSVTGTSGSLTHVASATFNFQDFTISPSPTTVSVNAGVSGGSTITVSPLNGFTGTVTISASPPPTTLLVCSILSPTISGGSGMSGLICSGPAGIFNVPVKGTSGSISHSAVVTFDIASTTTSTCGASCVASVTSDATITNFSGNATLLSFTASGVTGTTAFANVTIPKSAVPNINALQVSINGTTVSPTISSNSTSYFVYFTFTFHSAFVIQIQLVSTSAAPVLLTFQGFDLDDWENGVGQLQVLVNGHLVVDIPSGLNHLTGSGDYAPYDNEWVKFGPFDITSFVVHGQNTILFIDPQTGDHFGIVKNVTIVQGSTVLLHVERARGVFREFSFSYTFSIPPLVITSFTSSLAASIVDQQVTFTVTYTGGTAPFRCIFSFGDSHFAFVTGVNGSCSATHSYDFNGTFHAMVTVKGASTSDIQMAKLSIIVTGNDTDETDPTTTVALATVQPA